MGSPQAWGILAARPGRHKPGAGSPSLTDRDASQHLLTRGVACVRFFATPKSDRIPQKKP